MIKPGSVCYLVNLPGYPEHVGRVVTAVSLYEPGWWTVDAPWLREFLREVGHKFATARSSWLRPINDPDEPVTTRTPEELTA